MEINQEVIKALLEAFDRSDWREMTVTVGGDRLHVSRDGSDGRAAAPPAPRRRGLGTPAAAGRSGGGATPRRPEARRAAAARHGDRVAVGRAVLARPVAGCAAVRRGRRPRRGGRHRRDRRGDEADEPRGRAGRRRGHGDPASRTGRRSSTGSRSSSSTPRAERPMPALRARARRQPRRDRGAGHPGLLRRGHRVGARRLRGRPRQPRRAARRPGGRASARPRRRESYLDVDRVVAAAKVTGCDALHPGYGFLSERPELSAACAEAGIAFVGPSAEAMRRSGDKATARALASELGVADQRGLRRRSSSEEEARAVADEIGYPVLLKAAGGGGGRGMRLVEREAELAGAFAQAARRGRRRPSATAASSSSATCATPATSRSRCWATARAASIHLGHRDCTLQRRYQKLIEEAPALRPLGGARARDPRRRACG